MQQRKWARATAAVVLAGFLPLTACFGSFSLVRKVHSFNADVSSDPWVREGVFLLLNVPYIPVYALASAVDVLFLNSVEFWTGDYLLAQDTTRTVEGEYGEISSATFHPDGTADLTIVEADGTTHVLRLVNRNGVLEGLDESGDILARAADMNGRAAIIDAEDNRAR